MQLARQVEIAFDKYCGANPPKAPDPIVYYAERDHMSRPEASVINAVMWAAYEFPRKGWDRNSDSLWDRAYRTMWLALDRARAAGATAPLFRGRK